MGYLGDDEKEFSKLSKIIHFLFEKKGVSYSTFLKKTNHRFLLHLFTSTPVLIGIQWLDPVTSGTFTPLPTRSSNRGLIGLIAAMSTFPKILGGYLWVQKSRFFG